MALNYQSWRGFDDPRYGYGRHTCGYTQNIPANVRLNPKASVDVFMGVPDVNLGWWEGQYRVLHTMWETDELPAEFSRYLVSYDQIVVPCQHNVTLFSRYHPNVVAVPEGVDRSIFCPQQTQPNKVFQFRAGGSLWARKGLDLVVEAFNRLNLPDSELRLKVAPHCRDAPSTPLGDRIFMDREWMTEEEQVAWLAQADCFIAASRGEGWGLMPTQTISMAVPTILSLTSGHLEFADLATATVPCTPVKGYPVGNWDEPDLDTLCEKMLWAYENRTEARRIARDKAEGMDRFSWEAASQALVDCLPVGKLLKTSTWVEPTFRVVALRNITADIGETHVRQSRGDEFTATNCQYQVLHASGAVRLAEQK